MLLQDIATPLDRLVFQLAVFRPRKNKSFLRKKPSLRKSCTAFCRRSETIQISYPPSIEKIQNFSIIMINQQVLFIKHLLSQGNIPLLLEYILSLLEDGKTPLPLYPIKFQKPSYEWSEIEKSDYVMKPMNSQLPSARKFKFIVTLHFKIDGLSILSLQNLNFQLFFPREANKAKHGEGRIKRAKL